MTKGSATVYTVLKIFNWYVLAEVGQRKIAVTSVIHVGCLKHEDATRTSR